MEQKFLSKDQVESFKAQLRSMIEKLKENPKLKSIPRSDDEAPTKMSREPSFDSSIPSTTVTFSRCESEEKVISPVLPTSSSLVLTLPDADRTPTTEESGDVSKAADIDHEVDAVLGRHVLERSIQPAGVSIGKDAYSDTEYFTPHGTPDSSEASSAFRAGRIEMMHPRKDSAYDDEYQPSTQTRATSRPEGNEVTAGLSTMKRSPCLDDLKGAFDLQKKSPEMAVFGLGSDVVGRYAGIGLDECATVACTEELPSDLAVTDGRCSSLDSAFVCNADTASPLSSLLASKSEIDLNYAHRSLIDLEHSIESSPNAALTLDLAFFETPLNARKIPTPERIQLQSPLIQGLPSPHEVLQSMPPPQKSMQPESISHQGFKTAMSKETPLSDAPPVLISFSIHSCKRPMCHSPLHRQIDSYSHNCSRQHPVFESLDLELARTCGPAARMTESPTMVRSAVTVSPSRCPGVHPPLGHTCSNEHSYEHTPPSTPPKQHWSTASMDLVGLEHALQQKIGLRKPAPYEYHTHNSPSHSLPGKLVLSPHSSSSGGCYTGIPSLQPEYGTFDGADSFIQSDKVLHTGAVQSKIGVSKIDNAMAAPMEMVAAAAIFTKDAESKTVAVQLAASKKKRFCVSVVNESNVISESNRESSCLVPSLDVATGRETEVHVENLLLIKEDPVRQKLAEPVTETLNNVSAAEKDTGITSSLQKFGSEQGVLLHVESSSAKIESPTKKGRFLVQKASVVEKELTPLSDEAKTTRTAFDSNNQTCSSSPAHDTVKSMERDDRSTSTSTDPLSTCASTASTFVEKDCVNIVQVTTEADAESSNLKQTVFHLKKVCEAGEIRSSSVAEKANREMGFDKSPSLPNMSQISDNVSKTFNKYLITPFGSIDISHSYTSFYLLIIIFC